MHKYFILFMCLGVTVTSVSLYSQFKRSNPERKIAGRFAQQAMTTPRIYSLKETQRYIEQNSLDQIEYTGTLIREDIDLFQGPVHIQRFFIENENERIQINPVNKEAIAELSGKEVTLTGWREHVSEKLVGFVKGVKSLGKTNQAPSRLPPLVRYEKMLVVMADFNDSTPLPVGPEWVSTQNIGDFLNTKTFQDYFYFTYQGKIKNTVTKVVEYRFRRNCADKNLPGYTGVLGYIDNTDINLLFSELNLDPRDYNNVSVLANCNGNSAWGIGTSANVNGVYLTMSNLTMWPSYFKYGSPDDLVPYMPIPPGWTFLNAFVHERLHTFGQMHANGLDCGSSTLLFPCSHIEYGNPFDVMGRANPSYQLNAHHMRKANVRPESQYITISKPGTYSLSPLESKDKRAIIAAYIKIPEVPAKVFMLEHRRAQLFDRSLLDPRYNEVPKGLLIYSSINPHGSSASYSEYDFRIVDPYPIRNTGILKPFSERVANRSLAPRSTFYDPITGVRIVVDNNKNEKITFKVDFEKKSRMCFKAQVSDIIEPFYFEVNGADYDPYDVVTLRPGDVFTFKTRTHQVENSICPKIYVNTTIFNTEMITTWVITKDGPILNPEFVAKDKPWPGEGGGDGDPYPTIEGSFPNTNQNHYVTTKMRVPADAPAGDYELPVHYKRQGTNEKFESVLKFRILKTETPGKVKKARH